MSDAAVVLAAGKGTRMRSSLPKVLHHLGGKPMLLRVLNCLQQAGFECPVVVVGYGADQIEAALGDRCVYVHQEQQLGTGDAVRIGVAALAPDIDSAVVMNGDEPLIPASAIRTMLDTHRESGAAVTLLTTRVADTRGFGRVIRDKSGKVVALVQEADLLPEQQRIDEVNLGAYVFSRMLLTRLDDLPVHQPKGEYYLTDLVAMAASAGSTIEAVEIEGGPDVMGINDLVQLEQANRALSEKTCRRLMEQGVTIVNNALTCIDEDVRIEADSIIHPFCTISGNSSIAQGCVIGPGATIVDSVIGSRSTVVSSTVEEAEVGDDVRIGPYAHLRPGARIGARAEIGNYAEVKNSTIGPDTKMHHFGYVGDAEVGMAVNVGAGVVTCNFDGHRKHRTVIGDGAFVGSDTMLRAPITIGTGAYTGAGSVVTRDVPPGTLAAGVPARVVRRVSEPRDDQEESSDGVGSEV